MSRSRVRRRRRLDSRESGEDERPGWDRVGAKSNKSVVRRAAAPLEHRRRRRAIPPADEEAVGRRSVAESSF